MRIFSTADTTLAAIHQQLLPPAADMARLQAIVDDIIARVRVEGDAALLELTQRFDWPMATLPGLRVTAEEMAAAVTTVDAALLHAMTMAIEKIRRFHQRQMPQDWFEEMEYGLTLGVRHTPVDSAACYVPTGKASLPSSLLMSVIPAQVAGVPRIAVAGPCRPDGAMPVGVLAAAHLLGITEVYKIGGAQAMAALALGTATVARVDKLVGPANIFGTLAKKALFGEVGIDGLNGPSDVTIIADGSVPPAWIACDLLSQSEHGEDSQSVLLTPDAAYADAVAEKVATQLAASPRAQYLSVSLARRGALVITRDLAEAAALTNLIAPEHLELAVADPHGLLPAIRHAGAIFLGGYTPVPVGDYLAGPSHVLPTEGTARFAGGLGVMDFLKRSSLIAATPDWLRQECDTIATFAAHEELAAHADAVRRRS